MGIEDKLKKIERDAKELKKSAESHVQRYERFSSGDGISGMKNPIDEKVSARDARIYLRQNRGIATYKAAMDMALEFGDEWVNVFNAVIAGTNTSFNDITAILEIYNGSKIKYGLVGYLTKEPFPIFKKKGKMFCKVDRGGERSELEPILGVKTESYESLQQIYADLESEGEKNETSQDRKNMIQGFAGSSDAYFGFLDNIKQIFVEYNSKPEELKMYTTFMKPLIKTVVQD